MAIVNFTASIWAKEVLRALRKSQVYANIVNTDYEGEVKKGASVRINSITDVTIGAYVKGNPITVEALSDAQQTLTITQQDYFAFAVENIDAAQTESDLMAAAMESAGYGLKNKADQFIAALYSGVAAANIVGLGNDTTPIVPTAATLYEYLVDMGVRLDESDVPEDGRWVVLPPWCRGLMQKDDRFTLFKEAILVSGKVAQVDNMTVYVSNNVPNTAGAKYKIMAGHKSAITFADQIDKVKPYEPEDGFQEAVKGLHTYGAKLVRPTAIAVATFSKA